ncbi:MAG: class I SAM-dependent methyltransferase [Patescibacteria group bacterium]
MEKKEIFQNWLEIPTTHSRSIDKYFDDLNLTSKRIEGKTILDIGAGVMQFAKGVSDSGIDAKVYSLDPFYSSPEKKSVHKKDDELLEKFVQSHNNPDLKDKIIGGYADKIPFCDSAFDMVISEYSMPLYARSVKEIDDFFDESLRVVKDNGEVRICPFWNLRSNEFRERVKSKLKEMEKNGLIRILKNEDNLAIFQKIPKLSVDKI